MEAMSRGFLLLGSPSRMGIRGDNEPDYERTERMNQTNAIARHVFVNPGFDMT